jgi:hypothetical protein
MRARRLRKAIRNHLEETEFGSDWADQVIGDVNDCNGGGPTDGQRPADNQGGAPSADAA